MTGATLGVHHQNSALRALTRILFLRLPLCHDVSPGSHSLAFFVPRPWSSSVRCHW